MPFDLAPALAFLHEKDKDSLTIRQLRVLLECKKEKQTVRGLAERLGVSKPAITRAANRLSLEGLVSRTVDPLDRRSIFLDLTAVGKRFTAHFA